MERTCNKCGWVHFAVTREHATAEVARFNEYFDKLTPKEQQDYYGGYKSSIEHYEQCSRCGGSHIDFRDAREGDCGPGHTIGPIIHE